MKTREEKAAIVDNIINDLNTYSHFYITDAAGLNAENTTALRRECFKTDIKFAVVKNTLLKRAFKANEIDYSEFEEELDGPTAIMYSNTGNAPAKLIKKFRKSKKKLEKPVLKAAYIEEEIYKGDDQLDVLENIKSREELIADVVLLLQSPTQNLMSALNSGATNITGVLKSLEEKE